MSPGHFLYRLHLHIGKLSEASLKHRSTILLLSILISLIDPSVTISFGSASLAGLGISVNPPQELSVGALLLALLIYRLIAFWVSVLLESGTDSKRVTRKALLDFEPAWEAEEYRPGDIGQLISQESEKVIHRWSVRQLIWELVIPNLIAIIALTVFITKFLGQHT